MPMNPENEKDHNTPQYLEQKLQFSSTSLTDEVNEIKKSENSNLDTTTCQL